MYLGGDARPQQWFSVGGDVCPSGDTGPCLESCLVVCMGEMHRTPPPPNIWPQRSTVLRGLSSLALEKQRWPLGHPFEAYSLGGEQTAKNVDLIVIV